MMLQNHNHNLWKQEKCIVAEFSPEMTKQNAFSTLGCICKILDSKYFEPCKLEDSNLAKTDPLCINWNGWDFSEIYGLGFGDVHKGWHFRKWTTKL